MSRSLETNARVRKKSAKTHSHTATVHAHCTHTHSVQRASHKWRSVKHLFYPVHKAKQLLRKKSAPNVNLFRSVDVLRINWNVDFGRQCGYTSPKIFRFSVFSLFAHLFLFDPAFVLFSCSWIQNKVHYSRRSMVLDSFFLLSFDSCVGTSTFSALNCCYLKNTHGNWINWCILSTSHVDMVTTHQNHDNFKDSLPKDV